MTSYPSAKLRAQLRERLATAHDLPTVLRDGLYDLGCRYGAQTMEAALAVYTAAHAPTKASEC